MNHIVIRFWTYRPPILAWINCSPLAVFANEVNSVNFDFMQTLTTSWTNPKSYLCIVAMLVFTNPTEHEKQEGSDCLTSKTSLLSLQNNSSPPRWYNFLLFFTVSFFSPSTSLSEEGSATRFVYTQWFVKHFLPRIESSVTGATNQTRSSQAFFFFWSSVWIIQPDGFQLIWLAN